MLSSIKMVFVLLFFYCSASIVHGQTRDSLSFFSGQVISKEGKYPVSLAHIINLQQHWGEVADTMGYFGIWVKPNDTLNISALGFDYLEFPVKKIVQDSIVIMHLQSRYYEIPEVSIVHFGTYREFKQKVLDLELPESGINEELLKIFKHAEVQGVVVPNVSGPASLFYNLFSKEVKDIRKYIELTQNQKEVDESRKRYNEDIIQSITGLNELEIREFMAFCDFKFDYILSVSDYKLYSDIIKRFEDFKKSKQDSLIKE